MTVRTNAIAAAIAACAALFASPAGAVDGEILIDQAKVNAGGITPGDDPGFPAMLSKSGRYKMTGNLRVPAGKTGIEVAQHDVTIDLNGFTISSNPPGEAAAGVHAPNSVGLRVMNGTITGFQSYGIVNSNMGALGPGVVENMRIVSNGSGVLFVRSGSQVRNSTIADNNDGWHPLRLVPDRAECHRRQWRRRHRLRCPGAWKRHRRQRKSRTAGRLIRADRLRQ